MEFSLNNTKYVGLALGIISLIALTFLLPEIKSTQIEKISEENIGEKIKLVGIIKKLNISSGNAFFELENNSKINSVYFKPKTTQLSILRENRLIEVIGKVSFYRGKLQIIVEKVKRID